jgi:tetratricopeptide (TPR) repeat protein
MTAPPRTLLAVFLLAAVGPTGCTTGGEKEAAGASDPERRRVLQFWEHFQKATRVRSGGDCAAAVALYEKALTLDPEHEDSLYYLGQCRRQLGEPGAARQAFGRLVAVNPQSARGHQALGALLASPDPAEPMDLQAAEAHLRRAHEINGEETGPVVRLGEVTLAAGRPEEARAWFEAALQTNARSVEAALLAGYIAWEAGEAPAPLVGRVMSALAEEAPAKGVLNERDHRDGRGRLARPLSHPLGRLLFGAPVDSLRARAAAGETLTEADVLEAWREVRRLRDAYHGPLRAAPVRSGKAS